MDAYKDIVIKDIEFKDSMSSSNFTAAPTTAAAATTSSMQADCSTMEGEAPAAAVPQGVVNGGMEEDHEEQALPFPSASTSSADPKASCLESKDTESTLPAAAAEVTCEEDYIDDLCFRSYLTIEEIEDAARQDEANRVDSDSDDESADMLGYGDDIWQYPWAGEGCGMSPVYSTTTTTDRFDFEEGDYAGASFMSSSREGSFNGAPRCSTSMDSGIGLSPATTSGLELYRSSPALGGASGRKKRGGGCGGKMGGRVNSSKKPCETYIPSRQHGAEDNCENVGAGKSMLMNMLLTANGNENGAQQQPQDRTAVYKTSLRRELVKVKQLNKMKVSKLGPTGKRQYIRRKPYAFRDIKDGSPLKKRRKLKLKKGSVCETVMNGNVEGEEGGVRLRKCARRLDGEFDQSKINREMIDPSTHNDTDPSHSNPALSPGHHYHHPHRLSPRPSTPRKKRIRRMKQMKGFICDMSSKTLGFADDTPTKSKQESHNSRRIALPEPILENGFRQCSLCGFSSKYSPSLARHKAVVHGIVTPGQKVFKCPVCPLFLTTYKSKYVRHVRHKHPEEVTSTGDVRLNKQQITEEMAEHLVKIDGARCRKKWKENAITIPNGDCGEGDGEEGGEEKEMKKKPRVRIIKLPNGEVIIKPKRKYVRKKPLPGKKLPAGAEPSSSTPTAELVAAPTTVTTVPTPTTPQAAQGAPMDYSFATGGGAEEGDISCGMKHSTADTPDSAKRAASPQTTAVTLPLSVHVNEASLPADSRHSLSSLSSRPETNSSLSKALKSSSLLEKCLTTDNDIKKELRRDSAATAATTSGTVDLTDIKGTSTIVRSTGSDLQNSTSLTPQKHNDDKLQTSHRYEPNQTTSNTLPQSSPPPPPPPQIRPLSSNMVLSPTSGLLSVAPSPPASSSLPAVPPLHRTSHSAPVVDQDMPMDLSVTKNSTQKLDSGSVDAAKNHRSHSPRGSDGFTPPVPPVPPLKGSLKSPSSTYPYAGKMNPGGSTRNLPAAAGSGNHLWTPYSQHYYSGNSHISPHHSMNYNNSPSPSPRRSYPPIAHSPTSSISSQHSSGSYLPNAPSLGHSPSPSPTPTPTPPPLRSSAVTPPLAAAAAAGSASQQRQNSLLSSLTKSPSMRELRHRRPSVGSTPPAVGAGEGSGGAGYMSNNYNRQSIEGTRHGNASSSSTSNKSPSGTSVIHPPISSCPPRTTSAPLNYPTSSRTPPAAYSYPHPHPYSSKPLSNYPMSKTPPGYHSNKYPYSSKTPPPGYPSKHHPYATPYPSPKSGMNYALSKQQQQCYPMSRTPPSYPSSSKTPPSHSGLKSPSSYGYPISDASSSKSHSSSSVLSSHHQQNYPSSSSKSSPGYHNNMYATTSSATSHSSPAPAAAAAFTRANYSSAPSTPHHDQSKSPSCHSNPEIKSHSLLHLQGQGQLMRAPPPVTIEDLISGERDAKDSPFMAQFEHYTSGHAGPLEIKKMRNTSWVGPDVEISSKGTESLVRNGEILTVPEVGILKEEELLNNDQACHISKLSTIVNTLESQALDIKRVDNVNARYVTDYKDYYPDSFRCYSVAGSNTDVEIGPPLLEPMVAIVKRRKSSESMKFPDCEVAGPSDRDDDAQSDISDKTIILDPQDIKLNCKVKEEDDDKNEKKSSVPSPRKTRVTRSRAQTEELLNETTSPRTISFKSVAIPDSFDFLPKFQSKSSRCIMRVAAKQKREMDAGKTDREETETGQFMVDLCQKRLAEILAKTKPSDLSAAWKECQTMEMQKLKEKKERKVKRQLRKKLTAAAAKRNQMKQKESAENEKTPPSRPKDEIESIPSGSHCCHGKLNTSNVPKHDVGIQSDPMEKSGESRRNSQDGSDGDEVSDDDVTNSNSGSVTPSSTHWKVTNKQRFLKHDAKYNKLSGDVSPEEMREMVHDSIKDLDLEDAGSDRWRVRYACCHSNHGTQTSYIGFYVEEYDNEEEEEEEEEEEIEDAK